MPAAPGRACEPPPAATSTACVRDSWIFSTASCVSGSITQKAMVELEEAGDEEAQGAAGRPRERRAAAGSRAGMKCGVWRGKTRIGRRRAGEHGRAGTAALPYAGSKTSSDPGQSNIRTFVFDFRLICAPVAVCGDGAPAGATQGDGPLRSSHRQEERVRRSALRCAASASASTHAYSSAPEPATEVAGGGAAEAAVRKSRRLAAVSKQSFEAGRREGVDKPKPACKAKPARAPETAEAKAERAAKAEQAKAARKAKAAEAKAVREAKVTSACTCKSQSVVPC